MKYIHHKELGLICFEVPQNHVKMIQRLGLDEKDIVSAGFITPDSTAVLRIQCGSHSVSLKKGAHALDTKRLQTNITIAKGF